MQPSCDPAAVVPISAATGVGLDRLLRQIARSTRLDGRRFRSFRRPAKEGEN
jgi:hypothetical protein